MQFPTSTTTLLLALSAFTTTLAAPSTNPLSTLSLRDFPLVDDPSKVPHHANQHPDSYTWNKNVCAHDVGSPARQWTVAVTDGRNYYKQCGKGFLDNFRGRCGTITTWECKYYNQSPNTAVMHFYTSVACTNYDISQAIKAAGKGLVINCNDDVGSSVSGVV